MSNSLGLAVNFYKEPNTLPGLLENASRFFDDMLFVSAPPKGAHPDDESIAIIEKWGARIIHTNIDDGFGVVRSLCLHASSTEWVMISDCDERIFPILPIYALHGAGRYPQDINPKLSVGIAHPMFSQRDRIREMLEHECRSADGIRLARRHWMNWSMTQPCQRWDDFPDWQLRLLRNRPYIGYSANVKMHEQCVDSRTGRTPEYATGDAVRGPFIDHFHVPAKLMEPEQRAEDIRIYDALHYSDTHTPVPTCDPAK
jgi:glycosyltransferase involved in cell wall biosynthesis